MKKMKLRKYVLPTIYVLIILVTFLSVSLINNHLLKNVTNYNYSKSIMKDVTENVLSEILPDKFERPYLSENVKLLSGFYSKDYDDESQKNSLIVYQNTYMPSSGTFYASQDDFDVVSVYDGKVKSIKKDEMLGDTVEVQHSDNLTTIYYSLKDVTVRENDDIKKGTIIGKATSNNLVTDKNVLFIEVYLKGKQIDPEKFYELNPMKSNNIIYFYENNVIVRFNDNIYYLKLNKNILNNGIILNKDKFIKKYNEFTKENNLKKIINNKMVAIIQNNISINDIKMLSIVFEELGIKIIKIIKDISLLNVKKNKAYLIGDNNLRLYFINKYNKKSTINMNTSQNSYNDIISIIQNNIKESLFVLSSNDDLINKLLKNKSYYLINNYIKFIFDEIG